MTTFIDLVMIMNFKDLIIASFTTVNAMQLNWDLHKYTIIIDNVKIDNWVYN